MRDWGFSYLKLDGLHIGMATRQTYPNRQYVEDKFGDAVFLDKTRSNIQAGRMGLAAVREAAGPETFMLNNQTDWAPDYPAERVDLLRRTMPCHQLTSVRPVDLFENDPPRVWVLNYDAGGVRRTTIGLFNWGDKDAEISVSAQRLGLRPDATYAGFEFWSSRTMPPLKGRLRERLPPRSSLILAVREIANHPLLLGTSRHVTQGAVDVVEEAWNASQQTLSGVEES